MIYSLCIFIFAFNKASITWGDCFQCKSAYACINLLGIDIHDQDCGLPILEEFHLQ